MHVVERSFLKVLWQISINYAKNYVKVDNAPFFADLFLYSYETEFWMDLFIMAIRGRLTSVIIILMMLSSTVRGERLQNSYPRKFTIKEITKFETGLPFLYVLFISGFHIVNFPFLSGNTSSCSLSISHVYIAVHLL